MYVHSMVLLDTENHTRTRNIIYKAKDKEEKIYAVPWKCNGLHI